jgi:hypothetical protein
MLEESLFRGGGVTERGALRLSSLLAGFGGITVSYAKMAASPKPSVNSLESSTTEEDPGDPGMDLKAANWKGQIKERRHSIGSHPENVKESESSSMKQKFGSQEVLNVCDQDVVLIDSHKNYRLFHFLGIIQGLFCRLHFFDIVRFKILSRI